MNRIRLIMIGLPANNFGNEEPGTNDRIKQFCSINFGVTFPMFTKISVKGQDIHLLYRYFTEEETNPRFAREIAWDFNKFLVDRSGVVIGRYGSAVEPLHPALVADVERALGRPAG